MSTRRWNLEDLGSNIEDKVTQVSGGLGACSKYRKSSCGPSQANPDGYMLDMIHDFFDQLTLELYVTQAFCSEVACLLAEGDYESIESLEVHELVPEEVLQELDMLIDKRQTVLIPLPEFDEENQTTEQVCGIFDAYAKIAEKKFSAMQELQKTVTHALEHVEFLKTNQN